MKLWYNQPEKHHNRCNGNCSDEDQEPNPRRERTDHGQILRHLVFFCNSFSVGAFLFKEMFQNEGGQPLLRQGQQNKL